MNTGLKRRQGAALLSVMAMMAIIFALSGAFFTTSNTELQLTTRAVQTTQLRYAAEAGIMWVLHEYKVWSLPCEKEMPVGDEGNRLGASVKVSLRQPAPDRLEIVSRAASPGGQKSITAIYVNDVLTEWNEE